jgi:hypothetical protein
MPDKFDIVRILSVGTIGLGFLLAFLAFRLLNREQGVARPRDRMLKAITGFMVFSFSLCVIGLSAELYRIHRSPANNPNVTPTQSGSFIELAAEELNPAKETASLFLAQLDESHYEEAYGIVSDTLKKTENLSDFKHQAVFYLKTFGKNKDRKFDSALKDGGETSGGSIYYITFVSAYENVPNTAETVNLVKTGESTFKVIGYSKR